MNEFFFKFRDFGLLIFRLGLGGMFMWHGYPKMIGGVAKWTGLGKTMAVYGITFAPAFWGFMASFAEFGGGLLFALGLFYRPASALLAFNMYVAFSSQMLTGKGLSKASQSLEDAFAFFSGIFVGPGKYSVDAWLRWLSDNERK